MTAIDVYNEEQGPDGTRRYLTSVYVTVYSHNTDVPIDLTAYVTSFSSNKSVKGPGFFQFSLTAEKNWLNLLFPNDYVNAYVDRGDGNGKTRIFYGFIDQISHTTTVSDVGKPDTLYTVACSDFQKAITMTQIYFNPQLAGRVDFNGGFLGSSTIGGNALRQYGLRVNGGPADLVVNAMLVLLGFGSQFVLPQSMNPRLLEEVRSRRANFMLNRLSRNMRDVLSNAPGGYRGFLSGLRSTIGTDVSLESLVDPFAVSRGDVDTETRARFRATATQLLGSGTDGSEVHAMPADQRGAEAYSILNTTLAEYPPTLLDVVDIFTFIERRCIDGYAMGLAMWEKQGNIDSFLKFISNDIVNELIFDLRPVSQNGILSNEDYSREADELSGNVGSQQNGVRYTPAVVFREYPFSTVQTVDCRSFPMSLGDESEQEGGMGIIPFGAIFSSDPNVPGRHVVPMRNIALDDLVSGHAPPGVKHLDVAVLPDTKIISQRLTRSDKEHFNLFEFYSSVILGNDARFFMRDFLPIITPVGIIRHGLRVRSLGTRFGAVPHLVRDDVRTQQARQADAQSDAASSSDDSTAVLTADDNVIVMDEVPIVSSLADVLATNQDPNVTEAQAALASYVASVEGENTPTTTQTSSQMSESTGAENSVPVSETTGTTQPTAEQAREAAEAEAQIIPTAEATNQFRLGRPIELRVRGAGTSHPQYVRGTIRAVNAVGYRRKRSLAERPRHFNDKQSWPTLPVGTPYWRYHNGIDIQAGKGSPVHAIADGLIVMSYPAVPTAMVTQRLKKTMYGNFLIIYHPTLNLYSMYAHLDRFIPGLYFVTNSFNKAANSVGRYMHNHGRQTDGIPVTCGQVIAYSGDTDTEGAPHLHFELIRHVPGKPVYPTSEDRTATVNGQLVPGPITDYLMTEAAAAAVSRGQRWTAPWSATKPVPDLTDANTKSVDPIAFFALHGVTIPTTEVVDPAIPVGLGIVDTSTGSTETPSPLPASDGDDGPIHIDDETTDEGGEGISSPENPPAAEPRAAPSSVVSRVDNERYDTPQLRRQLARWALLYDHWNQHNIEYLSGTIECVGSPDIRVGYRLDLPDRHLSFYVENVEHSWKYAGRMSTTLKVSRGQPNNPYPAYVLPATRGFDPAGRQRHSTSRLSQYFYTADPLAYQRGTRIQGGVSRPLARSGRMQDPVNVVDSPIAGSSVGDLYGEQIYEAVTTLTPEDQTLLDQALQSLADEATEYGNNNTTSQAVTSPETVHMPTSTEDSDVEAIGAEIDEEDTTEELAGESAMEAEDETPD